MPNYNSVNVRQVQEYFKIIDNALSTTDKAVFSAIYKISVAPINREEYIEDINKTLEAFEKIVRLQREQIIKFLNSNNPNRIEDKGL
jgi:hypothetical protein